MAKKKVKKSAKKKPSRTTKAVKYNEKKLKLSLAYFIFFAILYLIAVVFSRVFSSELLINVFWVIALVSGFVALAFLLIILIFLFLKIIKK